MRSVLENVFIERNPFLIDEKLILALGSYFFNHCIHGLSGISMDTQQRTHGVLASHRSNVKQNIFTRRRRIKELTILRFLAAKIEELSVRLKRRT